MSTLISFGFQGCWEQECMMVFSKKKLNKTSVKRLIFYKLGTSLQLKWEKLLVKDVQDRERTAPAKSLVAIGELQFDYVNCKNDRSNKKKLILTPAPSAIFSDISSGSDFNNSYCCFFTLSVKLFSQMFFLFSNFNYVTLSTFALALEQETM